MCVCVNMCKFSYIERNIYHTLFVNRLISQIPQCIRQTSHNAIFCNRNVHAWKFLLQNEELWDVGLVLVWFFNSVNCVYMAMLACRFRYFWVRSCPFTIVCWVLGPLLSLGDSVTWSTIDYTLLPPPPGVYDYWVYMFHWWLRPRVV